MAKVDCTELEATIAEIALTLGADKRFDSIDKIAAEMQKHVEGITREEVVKSINAASQTHERTMSEIAERVAAIKREARNDAGIREVVKQLEKHLKDATLPVPKSRRTLPVTDVIQSLRDLRQQLRREISGSDPAKIQRLEQSIERLQERLEKGIEAPAPKQDVKESKELERIRYERDKLQREVNARIRSLKPVGVWGRVAMPFNTARAIMTSVDFSAVFRQGSFIVVSHPVRAAKSLGPMFRSFASEQRAYEIMAEIDSRPNAPLYARSKLHISPLDSSAQLSKQEEVFMSRIADKLPLVGRSQRAYVVFLNKLRADSFDAMVATLAKNGEATQVEANAIANFVNVASGRGNLGRAGEQAAVTLNTVFFAPKYVASRFQLLAGQPLYGGTMRTRKLIAQEYARYMIGMGLFYTLAQLAFGDDDDFEIEMDPRSTDFGKLRFGNSRLDPTGGLSQVVVLASRVFSGKTKNVKGEVVPIRGPEKPFKQTGTVGYLGKFLRYKLSPLVGTGVNLVTREDPIARPTNELKEAGRLVVPLSIREVYEAMKEEGVPRGTALGLAAIFGMSLQTYEDDKKNVSQTRKSGRRRRTRRNQTRPSSH